MREPFSGLVEINCWAKLRCSIVVRNAIANFQKRFMFISKINSFFYIDNFVYKFYKVLITISPIFYF